MVIITLMWDEPNSIYGYKDTRRIDSKRERWEMEYQFLCLRRQNIDAIMDVLW